MLRRGQKQWIESSAGVLVGACRWIQHASKRSAGAFAVALCNTWDRGARTFARRLRL